MNLFKFLLLILITTFSYSKTILIDNDTNYQEILSSSEIYIDHSRELKIEDVIDDKVKFEENDKSVLGFGYSPDFDVWVKVTLRNNTSQRIERLIEYDNTLTSKIIFYQFEDEYLKEGLLNMDKNRKTINPILKIIMNKNQEKILYIKASSYITTLIIKLNLWEINNFYEKEIKKQAILALFFGAISILALYNLFIFFFTRDISYLFYVLYIFGIIFHQLIYVGMGSLYLFSEDMLFKIITHASFLVTFPAIALGLFTKHFLNTTQYRKLNYILNIFLFLIIIISPVFILTDEYNKYRNLLPFCLLIYLMFVTFYSAYKKNRQAYFILFGWVVFLTAGTFMYLSSAGVFNIYNIFPYYVEVSLVLEATIFSIALADRIKQLQKEKNKINKKLIIQEKEEGKRLKTQVEEKTKDLKEALDEKGLLLREIHHRVKNNMQTIISLMELQIDDIEDEKVEEIFKTVQNRIYAMSELHELLYREDVNITKINTYEYFDKIIDELRQSYHSEEINIKLNINTKIEIAQAIYCGLILNELVTNSMKYGFEAKEGNIIVTLNKIDNRYMFHIEDDGIGYDRSKKSDSLGLLLVDTLARKQLKGELNIDTRDGVKVDISWSGNEN